MFARTLNEIDLRLALLAITHLMILGSAASEDAKRPSTK